jgi:hypothetical protein
MESTDGAYYESGSYSLHSPLNRASVVKTVRGPLDEAFGRLAERE